MPANNVDLTAVLPVLDKAVKPFTEMLARTDAMPHASGTSDATSLRAYFGSSRLTLGDLRKLMSAIDAVRRVAGEP